MIFLRILFVSMAALTLTSFAAETTDSVDPQAQPGKVKYKTGKDVNFEELLIQGQLQRPEISVVTGNTQEGTDGLLRLRDNFLDRVASDFGEATE